MGDQERPEDVGASTERFEAFVRRGERLERQHEGGNTFRILTLVGGLVVLVAVIALLMR
jgi:hypothetical protein